MSDNGEVAVPTPNGYQVLPKEVMDQIGQVKLFGKWTYEDVEIRDISLTYVFSVIFCGFCGWVMVVRLGRLCGWMILSR